MCRRLIEDKALCGPETTYSLHAKSVIFDREVVFVGSFNLNPRSTYLNSETAMIVYSATLARRIAADMDIAAAPENSWRVNFDEDGRLVWPARTNGVDSQSYSDPEAGFWARTKSSVISIFPLDKYL